MEYMESRNVPEFVFGVVRGKRASLRGRHATVVKAMSSDTDVVAESTLHRIDDLREVVVSAYSSEQSYAY